ncbi:MAG: hypothetical protein WAX38_04970 [Minisyncoccia bacterium]
MNSHIITPIITFIAGIALVLLYIQYNNTISTALGGIAAPDVACTMEAKMCPDGSSVGRSGPTCAFAECPTAPVSGDAPVWRFVDAGVTDEVIPHTEVFATIRGTEASLGVYSGSCFENELALNTPEHASNKKLPNQIASVVCWYAGGGNEIGIFKDGEDVVVRVGDVDEGSAEVDGFRGNFQEILRVLPVQ